MEAYFLAAETRVEGKNSEQNVWDPKETYDCPLGYRWMSTAEAHKVFVGTIELEGHKPRGSNPSHFVELNQRLYFQASSTDFGAELWTTDGTRDGTYQVADVEFGSWSSEPRFLTAFNSRIFFSAKTYAYGRELWFSDGDPRFDFTEDQHATVGTGLLLDICVGAKSSSPQQFAVLNPSIGSPLLLFQADDCVHGVELWATDGTYAGTSLVLDIRQGTIGSRPAYLTSFAGQVFFQADDGIHGAELWVTNGFSAGTTMLVDIAPGALGSKPSHLTVLNSMNAPSAVLVFAAQAESDLHVEFWQSDGTVAGTTKVYSQSPEVVHLNVDSLNAQLSAYAFVSIPSESAGFFYLGRENDNNFPDVKNAQDVSRTRSITLQDVESMRQKRELTLSLSCSKGWLSLVRECMGVSFKLGDNANEKQTSALTLTGSLDALNCAVEKVVYHSKHQESGLDKIHVSVAQSILDTPSETNNDVQPGDARDSSYVVSKSMLVEIRAVNDPPLITLGSMYYAPRRQWVALSGIDIADPDSADGILYVSIAVLNGRLRVTLPPTNGPTVLHSIANGDTSRTLEFATTVAQAKIISKTLEYSCDDRDGCTNTQREYVTIQVDDNGFNGAGGPQMATKRTEIVVLEAAAV
ncbi:hypothetical protein BBO99_00007100 [Phytophthora kernoviae]|uniref:Cadherin domain-containing protein n=2 Tax=Phytophthora kernoviae TaxID=325452 RepID=A0A3R7JX26_9STRA|nr:hypothetical protein G195_008205 [Phytophthora kernoviae 00238/432]KAG2519220.1 hypothetical protein JM16_007256 [Phytophthora kernoviae]KAG2520860.1 hypothetical protein JM18_006713 [Phytophthora kernoviae]RLN32661.1 hypothetical protein BBI17_002122 [Phytophthora kernoviae]RLN77051.1 hypothetical protein BBO99_00007100 [Phytophthora kernoviae]